MFLWIVSKNSVVFISYSGHGSNRIDKNGDESDGYDECLCTYDENGANFIYDDEFNQILNNATKNRKNKIFHTFFIFLT